jgi:1,4-alpha-glucan branching enzyme
VPPERKKPWEPDLAAAAVLRDAADFVDTVLARLRLLADRDGRPGLVVAAFDTELFGHWWHEGPAWLATVLRALPAAGVRVTTLRGAAEAGHVGPPVTLGRSSWGSGKDWRVWEGPAVQDLVLAAKGVQDRLLSTLDAHRGPVRDPVLDQLAREALLALSSDWAFMISHDTAAGYARDRATTHAARLHELVDLLDAGDRAGAAALADRLRAVDGPFGHLDARVF